MTARELKDLLDPIPDEKIILVERLDINGDPIRNGDRCFPIDRFEELKHTVALGIHN